MTGIEKLRNLSAILGEKQPFALERIYIGDKTVSEWLADVADQIERETLPRPRFEDGEPVQFGDKYEAYGHVRTVEKIAFFKDRWIVSERFDNSNVSGGQLKRPEPPDTWEKLAADIERCDGSPCDYFERLEEAGGTPCCGCKAYGSETDCIVQVMIDLVRRCKALAEVE